jgi:hypothetical protein
MALNKSVLLVSFGTSDRKHNQRLENLLGDSFIIEHLVFTDPSEHTKEVRYRVKLSTFAHLISTPAIGFMIMLYRVFRRPFMKRKAQNYLAEAIQSYFEGHKSIMSLTLHLNRTLRRQKIRVLRSNQVVNAAERSKVVCVILAEDSNFYSSGLIIDRLQKIGTKVGVVDYTIGKKAEFEQSRILLVPDSDFLPYAIFARLFLQPSMRDRWIQTKQYIDSFPGSLETSTHESLTPSFGSGLADFYLSSDEAELKYLQSLANANAQVCLIEPIEVSLSKANSKSPSERNVFGLFLPPNQFSDPAVASRVLSFYGNEYETMIMTILEEVEKYRDEIEKLVIFPHPRTYQSEPTLISRISEKFTVSNDFAEFLSTMRCAVIFSSAVFSALLHANIKVFNLDIYNYCYVGVFPLENLNFIQINNLKEIKKYAHDAQYTSPESLVPKTTVIGFLESYL